MRNVMAALPSKRKGKERKSIYIAPFCTKVHSKRSGVDHTVLPANNTTPAFPSWQYRWYPLFNTAKFG